MIKVVALAVIELKQVLKIVEDLLRIAVVDGMRNMYYDYAHKKAEVVAELRQELFGEVGNTCCAFHQQQQCVNAVNI
jgi:hypothetical protein